MLIFGPERCWHDNAFSYLQHCRHRQSPIQPCAATTTEEYCCCLSIHKRESFYNWDVRRAILLCGKGSLTFLVYVTVVVAAECIVVHIRRHAVQRLQRLGMCCNLVVYNYLSRNDQDGDTMWWLLTSCVVLRLFCFVLFSSFLFFYSCLFWSMLGVLFWSLNGSITCERFHLLSSFSTRKKIT